MTQPITVEDHKKFIQKEIERRERDCIRTSSGAVNISTNTGRDILVLKDMIAKIDAEKKMGIRWAFDKEGNFNLTCCITSQDMDSVILSNGDGELVQRLFEKNSASCVLQAVTIITIEIERSLAEKVRNFKKEIDEKTGGPAQGNG